MALPATLTIPSPTTEEGYRIELIRPNDTDAVRNRPARLASFLLTTAAVLTVPTMFGAYWGSLFSSEFLTQLGGLAGFVAGGFLWSKLSSRLILYNPEWNAYVTNNVFGGENIPYGPGLHLTHLWERRNKDGNYSLEKVTKEFSISVQTKTSKITATGFFQYAIDLSRIINYIGSDATTLEKGLTAFIESFLTQAYANQDAEQARSSVSEVNAALANRFMGVRNKDGTPVTEFENIYGVIVVGIVIGGLKFPDAVQKTRDSIDEAARLHEVVARLHGMSPEILTAKMDSGDISPEQFQKMLNRAMATSGNASMNINVLETDVGAAVAAIYKHLLGKELPGAGK